MALPFLGVSFPSFLCFKERSRVDIFLGSEDLPLFCKEPEDELLFFCLDCEEPLPLWEDDLLLLFFSDLLLEELAAGVLHVISTLCYQ